MRKYHDVADPDVVLVVERRRNLIVLVHVSVRDFFEVGVDLLQVGRFMSNMS